MMNIFWGKKLILEIMPDYSKSSVNKQAGGKCWSIHLARSEIVICKKTLPPHTPSVPVPNPSAASNLEIQWIIQLLFFQGKDQIKSHLLEESTKKSPFCPNKVWSIMQPASDRTGCSR